MSSRTPRTPRTPRSRSSPAGSPSSWAATERAAARARRSSPRRRLTQASTPRRSRPRRSQLRLRVREACSLECPCGEQLVVRREQDARRIETPTPRSSRNESAGSPSSIPSSDSRTSSLASATSPGPRRATAAVGSRSETSSPSIGTAAKSWVFVSPARCVTIPNCISSALSGPSARPRWVPVRCMILVRGWCRWM